MGGALPLLEVAAGVALLVTGLALVRRSFGRLRRVGAFNSLYWASFRHFSGYRLRTLRPLGSALLGLSLAVAGLVALYAGTAAFYSGRLLNVGG
jgi:hypothetical protein